MSESYCQTVVIESVEKHSNADKLDVCTVLGGYPCISTRGAWKVGDLATYVSVDMLVPVAHSAFDWLATEAKGKTHHRVKARRLRGIFSMGLLVPAVAGTEIGQDVSETLGVLKYVPPSEARIERTAQHNASRSSRRSETIQFDRTAWLGAAVCSVLALVLFHWYGIPVAIAFAALAEYIIRSNRRLLKRPNAPIYDIEGLRRFSNVIKSGEDVVITEKIHGMNARFVYTKRLYCGSRTQFRDGATDTWVQIAARHGLEEKLKKHPNVVLFGEIYGKGVQDLEYGCSGKEFAAFDAMNLLTREYMNAADFEAFCISLDLPMVPMLYKGPWSEELKDRAEGHSIIPGAKHIREGFVVKPLQERTEHGLGRCTLKFVGQGYLTRKEKSE